MRHVSSVNKKYVSIAEFNEVGVAARQIAETALETLLGILFLLISFIVTTISEI